MSGSSILKYVCQTDQLFCKGQVAPVMAGRISQSISKIRQAMIVQSVFICALQLEAYSLHRVQMAEVHFPYPMS